MTISCTDGRENTLPHFLAFGRCQEKPGRKITNRDRPTPWPVVQVFGFPSDPSAVKSAVCEHCLSSLAAVLQAPGGRRRSRRGGPGREQPPQAPHQMSVGRPHFTGATLPLASSPSRRPKQRPPFPAARPPAAAVPKCLHRITVLRRPDAEPWRVHCCRNSPFGIWGPRARLVGRPASIGSAPREDLRRRRRCFAGGSC